MGKTTREDILRVATEIFKEKGFQRASMRDIAGKIGINQGSLYNFFSSKEAIFYQIAKDTMDDSLRIFKKITKEDVAPLEEIKVIIKNHIKLLCSRLEEITILLHDFRGLNEDHQREMIEKRRVFERYIEEVLIEGVNKGIFQIKDTKMATYALLGMDNWIYQWYSPDGKFKPEGMAELFIELFLKGILKDKKMKEYKKLFTPFKIGHLRLQNRVTMAPFFTGYGNKNGTVSKKLLEHHRRIARGETAMIVVEATLVSPSGKGWPTQLRIDHDRFIPGLKKLASIIKDNGAVACIQLQHAGRFARVRRPLSASKLPYKLATGAVVTSRQMTIEEIENTINDFACAALRAKESGFDMVELHGATGYLLTQFISPRTNKRTDRYGGSLKKRILFPIEIAKEIKSLVSEDFPVGYRFLADEFLPDGFQIDEARVFAKELEKAGISYLSVTGGTYESMFLPEVREIMKKEGSTVFLAEEIKKVVKVPVFGNGRIVDPYYADSIIASGKVDAVASARPLFADPDFAIKSKNEEIDKIIKCIDCGNCAEQIMKSGKPAACSQWEEGLKGL